MKFNRPEPTVQAIGAWTNTDVNDALDPMGYVDSSSLPEKTESNATRRQRILAVVTLKHIKQSTQTVGVATSQTVLESKTHLIDTLLKHSGIGQHEPLEAPGRIVSPSVLYSIQGPLKTSEGQKH